MKLVGHIWFCGNILIQLMESILSQFPYIHLMVVSYIAMDSPIATPFIESAPFISNTDEINITFRFRIKMEDVRPINSSVD